MYVLYASVECDEIQIEFTVFGSDDVIRKPGAKSVISTCVPRLLLAARNPPNMLPWQRTGGRCHGLP